MKFIYMIEKEVLREDSMYNHNKPMRIWCGNNDTNINILHEIGFNDTEISEYGYCEGMEDEYIDIAYFAFRYADNFNGETKKFCLEN